MKYVATALWFIIIGIAPLAASEQMPALPVQTLAGKPLMLPAELPDQAVLLIIGFSRASRHQTSLWFQHMQQHFRKNAPKVSLYKLNVLDVPGFLQSFVIGKIRASVTKQQRPYHLVAVEKTAQWKTLVHFKQSERAYLMLMDAKHRMVWQCSGEFSNRQFMELLKHIHTTGKPSPSSN